MLYWDRGDEMKKVFFCALLSVILLMGCSCSPNMSSESKPQLSGTESSPNEDAIVEKNYLCYSPYVVTDGVRQQLGEEYALYCRMVDAVVSYEGCVSGFQSEQHFVKMWSVLINEFVPTSKLIQTYKHTDTPYTYHEGTVQLKFQHDRSTHDQYLAEFESKINKVLSAVQADDSDVEVIAKLYEYVSYNMKYAMLNNNTLYDCFMDETGVCGGYARYLEFLLNHAGIECQVANGSGAGVDHTWVIAKIDGQWYHFDPTWEASFPRWYWFGVGDNLRHNSLVTGWIENYMNGTTNREMDKSGLHLTGEWDYFEGQYLAPPECPLDFKPNSRRYETSPELW